MVRSEPALDSGSLASLRNESVNFFPSARSSVNVTGSFVLGFFAALTDPEGTVSGPIAIPPIFHDRRVWRLHHVFVVQFANARSGSQDGDWFNAGLERAPFLRVLPAGRVARSNSAHFRFVQPKRTTMQIPEDAVLLRIFIGESDRHRITARFMRRSCLKAREMQMAGATVLRGPMGFGKSSHCTPQKSFGCPWISQS